MRLFVSEIIDKIIAKCGVTEMPKIPVWEHLWTACMLKGPKHCLNQRNSIFVIFFGHSERKSAQKIPF